MKLKLILVLVWFGIVSWHNTFAQIPQHKADNPSDFTQPIDSTVVVVPNKLQDVTPVVQPVTPTAANPAVLPKSFKTAEKMPVEGPSKDAHRQLIERMPRRATLRSLIIPGFGQLTNRRWWKVPLIYGGLILFYTEFKNNQASYRSFLAESQARADGRKENSNYSRYSDTGIYANKDLYRRNRDICMVSMVAVYAANVLDAYVDAKFFRFDISDKLTLRVNPSLQASPEPNTSFAMLNPAIKISLTL